MKQKRQYTYKKKAANLAHILNSRDSESKLLKDGLSPVSSRTPDLKNAISPRKSHPIRGSHILNLQIPSKSTESLKGRSSVDLNNQVEEKSHELASILIQKQKLSKSISELQSEIETLKSQNGFLKEKFTRKKSLETQLSDAYKENEFLRSQIKGIPDPKDKNWQSLTKQMKEFKKTIQETFNNHYGF